MDGFGHWDIFHAKEAGARASLSHGPVSHDLIDAAFEAIVRALYPAAKARGAGDHRRERRRSAAARPLCRQSFDGVRFPRPPPEGLPAVRGRFGVDPALPPEWIRLCHPSHAPSFDSSAALRAAEHIAIAAQLVAAAKTGNESMLVDPKARWYANADEIAAFLADANPNLPRADLQAMMRTHLDQTLAEASARLGGDRAGDIQTYDAIVVHVLHMADALSDGIAKQFPDRL